MDEKIEFEYTKTYWVCANCGGKTEVYLQSTGEYYLECEHCKDINRIHVMIHIIAETQQFKFRKNEKLEYKAGELI